MEATGRVVVITGGARGMGKAIGQRFLDNGDYVVLMDVLKDEMVSWAGANDNALIIECDIRSKANVEAARDQVLDRFGRVDVLVNNAGWQSSAVAFENISEDDWKKAFDVNVHGTFFCTQVFGSEMLDKGGAIVNIASMGGVAPVNNTGSYSASKAAIIMLTKQTTVQWARRGVRCNCVSPGTTLTDMNRAFYDTPGVRESREGAIPAARVGQTEDIANAVFFLSSPEADYVHGANLVVDGGFTVTALMPLKIEV